MDAREKVFTHRHGTVGWYLASGADSTARAVASSPGTMLVPPRRPPAALAPPKGPPSASTVPFVVVGCLVVAVAYFSLGVAVGALWKGLQTRSTATFVRVLLPGALFALGFLGWVLHGLR
jgi:hypothetical protein